MLELRFGQSYCEGCREDQRHGYQDVLGDRVGGELQAYRQLQATVQGEEHGLSVRAGDFQVKIREKRFRFLNEKCSKCALHKLVGIYDRIRLVKFPSQTGNDDQFRTSFIQILVTFLPVETSFYIENMYVINLRVITCQFEKIFPSKAIL